MDETTPPLPGLSPVKGQTVAARFDGGALSSDAGLLALREVERRLDVAGRLGACIDDPRDPARTVHGVADIARFPDADDRGGLRGWDRCEHDRRMLLKMARVGSRSSGSSPRTASVVGEPRQAARPRFERIPRAAPITSRWNGDTGACWGHALVVRPRVPGALGDSMAIRKILLPISGDDDIAPLADTAFHLATLFTASVEGLFAGSRLLNFPLTGERADPKVLREIIEQAQRDMETRVEQARTTHDGWARRHAAVDSSFVAHEGHPETVFARRGRLADLTVIGTARQYDSQYWRDVRDASLFRSGRPVLVAPGLADVGAAFDRVLVAWKEGVEAARAVTAAQPFIARAREVHVASIGEDDDTAAALKDVESYLRLHHAQVRGEILPLRQRLVGEVLLDKSEALGGALVVMGAYSHARWQERIFGGVTEFILHESTSPVLLLH